jgi:precorrin-8X/cobalt-precorrin-8 methylmutase
MPYAYETDGAAIYAESFATIRAEADLARFDPDEERVVVRMIHAAGLVGLERTSASPPAWSPPPAPRWRQGAPILCDARMVSEGITRKRLPADNPVICTLHDPEVPALAARLGHPLRRRARTLAPAPRGRRRRHRQRAHRALPPARMLEDPACPRPAAIIGCPWASSAPPNRRPRCGRRSPAPA